MMVIIIASLIPLVVLVPLIISGTAMPLEWCSLSPESLEAFQVGLLQSLVYLLLLLLAAAYKHADGKKIDGRRVLVDVERARTVKGWLPRRLGGGLGGTRRGGPEVNLKHSGREDNERERERYRLEREREMAGGRGDRDRDRERERDRDRDRGGGVERERRRSRSREREKRRRSRSRSRDRKRRRSRERVRDPDIEEIEDRPPPREREREKDRDRKRRRSKSRDKDRDRERRREKRDRDRDRDKERRAGREFEEGDIRIKEEPADDYPDYSAGYNYDGMAIKEEDEEKYRPEKDATNGSYEGNYPENY